MVATLPPGPKSNMFGLDFASHFKEDPLGTASSLHKEFGDISHIQAGPYHWYLVVNPDQVKEVLVTRHKEFGKTTQFKKVLGTVDGNGLVLSEGDYWLRQRRIIQGAFHHDMLATYADTMVEMTEKKISAWLPGMELDLADEMTHLTLTVAAKVFFELDVESGQAKELADAVTIISKALYREFTQVAMMPEWMPLPGKIEKRKAVATLDRLVKRAIEEHRESDGSQRSLLTMLLAARDTEGDGTGMTATQLRDEAVTLFNAGHDSTAAALSWTWYLLLKHPDIYNDLLASVDAVFGKEKATAGKLDRIPLALHVSKESLRLYPPAWTLPRQSLDDMELGGYMVPKGSLINLFAWITQRDPRFFENPDQFKPSRFAEHHDGGSHPFAYFPFGAGPRACIGRDFALMEMQLILITIMQRFTFELKPDSDKVTPNPLISLEPKEGVKVIVRQRT